MGLHAVYLLPFSVKFDGLTTPDLSARAGFFVGLLRVVLVGVFLQFFTILHGVSGVIQQAFFVSDRLITWME